MRLSSSVNVWLSLLSSVQLTAVLCYHTFLKTGAAQRMKMEEVEKQT